MQWPLAVNGHFREAETPLPEGYSLAVYPVLGRPWARI